MAPDGVRPVAACPDDIDRHGRRGGGDGDKAAGEHDMIAAERGAAQGDGGAGENAGRRAAVQPAVAAVPGRNLGMMIE